MCRAGPGHFSRFFVSSAQQNFPLRPGEWTAVRLVAGQHGKPGKTYLFCLNDETWAKVLRDSPDCSLQDPNFTPSGGGYSLDCATALRLNGLEKAVVAAGDLVSAFEPTLQADIANK